ncbi:hypothetical protein J5N97_002012 [Dioscorea zingiberensis]|uniref:Endonuclease/exonuclease/phosphatase domain-containing protein n=1 Tax=Dioscorea zingiberensis TaxID=325984 RepID=A0A9D5BVT2_9LILI|nr:hypothetical protein J5N97_002012 [Dioscorea zingiberensis]
MDSVKIVSWNCRGTSSPKTVGRIKALMRTLQPDIVCLVETRADEQRTLKFCRRFTKHWQWAAIPAEGMSGGIITLWKQRVGRITPIAQSRFSLHLVLSSEKPKEWIVTIIYNSQHGNIQKALWKNLSLISMLDLPWILLGDFNAILNTNEHRGGLFVNYSLKSRHFNDFLIQNQLFDLGFYGPPFTWCNNQGGLARRWARLDRFLANSAWLSSFDSYCNNHLPRIHSDHSPMFLIAKFFNHKKQRVFRFEDFWFGYDKCHKAVARAWEFKPNTTPMHAFSHLLSRTKNYLAHWRKNGLTPLDAAIGKTEEDISYIESIESSLQHDDLKARIALRSLYHKT